MKQTLIKLTKASREMRRLQAKYFQASPIEKAAILPICKEAEKKVDEILDSIHIHDNEVMIAEQTKMF